MAVADGSTWSNIAGASSSTYVVQEADEGNQLRVHVTSSGGSADSAATSPVTDILPTLTTPVISGTAQEGQTLTATAAVANEPTETTISYQWQANHGAGFVDITGATGLSYLVQEADEGAQLQLVATSTDADGSGITAISAATSAVIDAVPSLTIPVISGTAQEGQTLTATAAVSTATETTITYQWQANHGAGFVAITGATGLSYLVQEADEGAQLQLVATSTDADGSGITAISAATSAVIDAVPSLTIPVISGTAQEGQTLTATAAVSNEPTETTISYQWQANHGAGFVAITGATGLSYVVTAADVGAQIELVATSTDADGSGTTATSSATATVTSGLSVTVSGTAQEGQTLTASPSGSVTGYQWQSLTGSTWSNIAGASSSTYLVQEADEGNQLRVHVTSSGGSADSAATSPVIDILPTLTTPVISGIAQEGQTLTATAAVSNEPTETTISYQWQANHGAGFVDITGATGLSYLVQEADEGAQLQLVATSTDADGSGTTATSAATSAVIDAVPSLTAPVISGIAQEGQTLTATAAVSNEPTETTISYQWQANHGAGFVDITGATGLSYLVQEADEGAQLQLVATSTDADGSGTTATSAATSAVIDAVPSLTIPVISGTAQEGQTLTATAAVSNEPTETTISYQWQANHGAGFVAITGATGLSYLVQEADEGAQLQLVATSTDADGSGITAISAATSAVIDAVPSLTIPVISGIAQEGQTLTATAAVSNEPTETTISYQWQANHGAGFVAITGATGLSYLVQEADEGAQLQLVATSTDADGSGITAISAATSAVIDAVPSLTIPVISGTAQEGQTLTATAAVSNEPTETTISYQWQANHGAGFVAITGATGLSYVVTAADVGAQIELVATSTDADGSGTTATSSATATVTSGLSVTVSGTAQEGQTLTASPSGSVTGYQWQSLTGSTWSNIAGASSSTYVVQEADEGNQLRVHVTSSGGSADSAATSPVTDILPTLTTPVISGIAQEGQTLTATAAVSNEPTETTISYQWQANHGAGFVAITGATGLSYLVQEADEGAQLQLVATSTDADGSGTTATSAATSAVIDAVPSLTAPVISGIAQEGQTLTATAAVSNEPTETTISYQWQANHGAGFVAITGATGLSYLVQEADEGAQLQLVATSTDADGSGTTATSAATSAVIDAVPSLTIPVISGTAQEGQTLTATAAVSNEPTETTISYQWQANHGAGFVAITGATGLSYLVQEADEGAQLQLVATSTDADGSGITAISAATSAVIDAVPSLTIPVISGIAQEGQTLTATAAVSNEPTETTISYQWQANHGAGFVAITGATGLSYLVQEADEGAQLQLVATSTDADGSGITATSAATSAVIDAVPSLTIPVISGTAQEGQTLTATAAVSNEPTETTISYQWQANHGAGFVAITGATGLSYLVQEADEGAQLQLVATSTDADGSGTTATSAATSAVIDAVPSLTIPVISGTAQEGQTLTATAAVSNEPTETTISYQWQANHGAGFVAITGATGLSYVVTAADVGAQIELVATSTDADGSGTTATSSATATVTSGLSVTVSGTAQEGQTLTASPSGSVTGYQWQSLTGSTWSNIAGASSSTYVVQEADEGNQLRVHVTSSGGSADSAATSPVTDILPTLTTPVISGIAQEGQTLTATAAVSNEPTETTISYQWQANHGTGFVDITGATGLSYLVQEADEGAQLQLVATSTDADGSGTTATSAATSAVIDAVPSLTIPVISGIAQEGQTLTATAAVSNEPTETTISYQWQANHGAGFVAITGATGLSYLVQEADEGAQLQLVATSTDADGSGTTATSAATGTVTDPAPSLSVTLSGIAQEGKLLVASAVASSGDAIISYQWQVLNGANWRNIAAATTPTYLVTEANEGHQIRVIATSADADGGNASATSTATAPVIDITPTLSVTVSGIAQQGQILTANPSVVSDGDGGRTTYQWQEFVGSNWVNIAGATRSTYRVAEADEGYQIRIFATFTDDTNQTISAASVPTALVLDVTPVLSVTLTGTAQEGKTLTAHAHVTSDGDGGTTAFQWQKLVGATWTGIAGATAATYRIAEQDEGYQIRVAATFTDDTGQAASATSAATNSVIDIAPTLSVSIGGVAQDGQTLMATALANDDDAVISYQWQQRISGTWTNISRATDSSYTITEANEGNLLRVVATSVDSDGSGTSAISTATARVVDPAPTLTIASTSLFVPAGGSVSLPISVTGFDSDDRLTVSITGLPAFETITDALDHRTFSGGSVTLTAAEVNSGLTLHSTYGGSGQPVNKLTVTATNTTGGESVLSSAQTITVTDPPPTQQASVASANSIKRVVQPLNTVPLAVVTLPPGAGSPTLAAGNQSQAVTVGPTPTNNFRITYAIGGGRPTAVGKATVQLSSQGVDVAPADLADQVVLAYNEATLIVASELPAPGSEARTRNPGAGGPAPSKDILPGMVIQESKATDVRIALASSASPEQVGIMMGAQPGRSDLAQALFVGGILLPAITKRARAQTTSGDKNHRTRARSLCTFDSDTDRMVPEIAEAPGSFDLPSVIDSSATSDEDEWIYITMDAAE